MDGAQARPEITQLVLDHHREIYGYAFRLCGSIADAEDLSQSVFLTAQEKLGQLREVENVRGWLYAILRSHFLKLCRKKRPIPAATLEMNFDELSGPVEDAGEIDREALQKALSGLPESHRMVLVMFYYEQCSYQEIAERLETPVGTVMSRLARAKARLRAELTSYEQTRRFPAHPPTGNR
ncbi:MAG: RNA polymerase sigma factor [Thermoguttaceae bacterium]